MERTISVERLYTIADYQNIKFTTSLSGIPEKVALNEQAMQLLFYNQFLECDIAYRNYMELRNKIIESKTTNVLGALEEERTKTHTALLEEIKKELTKEEN